MTIKKTKKQVQVKEITIDERGQAMNDIAILLCNNKQMTYSEIQRHFDFTVSGILLEMELAGLIYQKHYECYVSVEEIIEETVEEIVEEIKSKTDLHKETDNARQEWLKFEDLANAFLDEYGSYPNEPTLKERNDWYYQSTENKRKRRSKHDVFNEKWNALFADRDWIKANWHEFVMEYLVLMTSRKEHRDFTSDHYVTKTKQEATQCTGKHIKILV